MRTLSVGVMKRTQKGPIQNLPREGSMLRAVYDKLYSERGRPIPLAEIHQALVAASPQRVVRRSNGDKWRLRTIYDQLQDFYGCDIRDHALVGQWFGRVYIDYTPEAEARA